MRDKLLSLLGVESGEESMVSMLLTQSVFLGIFFGAFDISAHSLFLSIFDEKMMARGYVVSGIAGIVLTSLYTWLQAKMKFRNFDMHELISTVIQNFEIRVHSDNGKITFLPNATDYTIYGDHVHITNVLFNLLDNAVKYSKENPEIEVMTENHKNKLVVSVKDHGIGIAKEHQKQIFERFYRVPTGNLHDVKGFGLGLHYVYKIIEAHNGTIEVESALNKGTTFIINFPITN